MTHDEIHATYFGNVSKYLANEGHDEDFLRDIEGRINIPEQGADDFRRMYAAFIGTLGVDVSFDGHEPVLVDRFDRVKWNSNPKLKEAIESYYNAQG